MKSTYKIAEKVICIDSLYNEVHDYCKDYRFDGTADITVTVTKADIDYERERSEHTAKAEGRVPFDYPDSYLEELAVYRDLSEKMINYGTFLFHGSCIAVDGVGYLFTAKSGTGKSTHTRLWRELLGSRAVMVNDDKPFININGGKVTVYGTPYNGKHRLGNNISVPLKAVCLLERAKENSIQEVSRTDVYALMLQQSYRPRKPEQVSKMLALLDEMLDNVKVYRLGCNMDIEAAKVAYEGMR